jgi:hypothetical protein
LFVLTILLGNGWISYKEKGKQGEEPGALRTHDATSERAGTTFPVRRACC